MKKLIGVALLALSVGASAQTSAAKKDLINKILQMQQPALEMAATALAERPAAEMMQEAGFVIRTRIPADKREAVAKEIQADVKKYVDQTVPMVRERAVNRKYLQLGGEMQKVLGEKLVAETQGTIEPKVKALQVTIAKRLGLPAKSAPAAGEAK